jgi:hypothetical protein
LILESCRGGQRNNGLEVRQILQFWNFETQNFNWTGFKRDQIMNYVANFIEHIL